MKLIQLYVIHRVKSDNATKYTVLTLLAQVCKAKDRLMAVSSSMRQCVSNSHGREIHNPPSQKQTYVTQSQHNAIPEPYISNKSTAATLGDGRGQSLGHKKEKRQ